MEPTSSVVRDYGITIAVAIVLALLIRGFVLETYRIPSTSMRPTLEPGDTLFVSKSAYGWRKSIKVPARGDVVVFTASGLDGRGPAKDYIRRVIALPGEQIAVKDGRVLLNGQPSEFVLGTGGCGVEAVGEGASQHRHSICFEPPTLEEFPAQSVPSGSVFVISDFRSRIVNHSLLDHAWGIVPVDSIKGKAALIWLSVSPQGGWFPQIRFDRMMQEVK